MCDLFELIFGVGCDVWIEAHFLSVDTQLLQYHLSKGLSFHRIFVHLCQVSVGHIFMSLFLGSLLCFFDHCVDSSANIMFSCLP